MVARATKLERLGLAEQIAPACWTLKPGLEDTLRQLSVRGDIIKTMHQAMSRAGREPDVSGFALHGEHPADPVDGVELLEVQRGHARAAPCGIDHEALSLEHSKRVADRNEADVELVEARREHFSRRD